MTDLEFEAFVQNLSALATADARGTTTIGRLYQPPAPTPSDTQRDANIHHHNDEWTEQ